MTAKRPWTADVEAGKLFGGGWALFEVERSTSHKRKFRLDDNKNGGFSEADARLIAAAPELYEALEAIVQAEDSDGSLAAFEAENARIRAARAALRAANPDAFDAESEGK